MAGFELRLEPATDQTPKNVFTWVTQTRESSYVSTFGPHLEQLDSVPLLNVDFVRLAAVVNAADKSVLRESGGSNWNSREFSLTIPVSDAQLWNGVASKLSTLVGFLTGDRWAFTFSNAEPYQGQLLIHENPADRVVLLSGGADSVLGALRSRKMLNKEQRHILVSHVSPRTISPVQKDLARAVEDLISGPAQEHIQISFGRRSKAADGSKYKSEPSSRSRSLLFLAFGLAVAARDGAPLWIPENGFASLNPPLGSERRGSLSTRTTHPAFLHDLSVLLKFLGAHGEIFNPFASMTKGEMFAFGKNEIGADAASTLLSRSHSCGQTGQRDKGISVAVPCGVCFGCLVRRASFHAVGITDATKYVDPAMNDEVRRWLDHVSVESAFRRLLHRGIRPKDVVAMSLPKDYPTTAALDLCNRGIDEMRQFLS